MLRSGLVRVYVDLHIHTGQRLRIHPRRIQLPFLQMILGLINQPDATAKGAPVVGVLTLRRITDTQHLNVRNSTTRIAQKGPYFTG